MFLKAFEEGWWSEGICLYSRLHCGSISSLIQFSAFTLYTHYFCPLVESAVTTFTALFCDFFRLVRLVRRAQTGQTTCNVTVSSFQLTFQPHN
jgi:hypothetical protein